MQVNLSFRFLNMISPPKMIKITHENYITKCIANSY